MIETNFFLLQLRVVDVIQLGSVRIIGGGYYKNVKGLFVFIVSFEKVIWIFVYFLEVF